MGRALGNISPEMCSQARSSYQGAVISVVVQIRYMSEWSSQGSRHASDINSSKADLLADRSDDARMVEMGGERVLSCAGWWNDRIGPQEPTSFVQVSRRKIATAAEAGDVLTAEYIGSDRLALEQGVGAHAQTSSSCRG